MTKHIEMVGRTFGRLEVISLHSKDNAQKALPSTGRTELKATSRVTADGLLWKLRPITPAVTVC